jgi:hypothetical protein
MVSIVIDTKSHGILSGRLNAADPSYPPSSWVHDKQKILIAPLRIIGATSLILSCIKKVNLE